MALTIVQWDSTNKKFKAGGGQSRAGRSSIGSGASSLVVTFSSALPSTSYAVTCTWQNTADTNPQQQSFVVTAFATTGFTVTWPAPTDSANYSINWIVMQQG